MAVCTGSGGRLFQANEDMLTVHGHRHSLPFGFLCCRCVGCLQADAAVLHNTLSKRPSGAAANKAWLLPGALDVVELCLDNALSYKCAPGMWLALAGCGHAVVSASLIAAAAQLVPLSSAAAAAASRLRVMSGPAQQQLDASLQLPDLESVELMSSTHAVVALEAAGWLHQQFTTAAGKGCVARDCRFCKRG